MGNFFGKSEASRSRATWQTFRLTLAPALNLGPAGFLRRAERGRLRPQEEWALLKAAKQGDLATLKRLVEERVDLEAKDGASAAPPAAPQPLSAPRPPPSPPSAPAAPRLAAAAHRVWRRRRASAGRLDGPQVGGSPRQARLPRAPHRQGCQA